jgi:hypothetical protein
MQHHHDYHAASSWLPCSIILVTMQHHPGYHAASSWLPCSIILITMQHHPDFIVDAYSYHSILPSLIAGFVFVGLLHEFPLFFLSVTESFIELRGKVRLCPC